MNRKITLVVLLLTVAALYGVLPASAVDQQSGDSTVNGIKPYDGRIPPEHPLHGFKVALEDLDEGLSWNQKVKFEKQIAHREERLSEYYGALIRNNDKAAARALELFQEKSEEAENSISDLQDDDSDSELEHAFEMVLKHQYVLENLNKLHPNRGLERAYENSKRLEQKFRGKLARHADEEEHEEGINEGLVKIKAKTNGSATEVEVSLKFKSDNVTNLTIAQEIVDRFKLSTENIDSLLSVENINKVESETELDAEAEIKNKFSKVETEYKFPLLGTTSRDSIVSGISLKLHALTVQDILNALEIKLEGAAKQEEIENEHTEKAAIKQTSREDREEEKENKAATKQTRHRD